MQLHNSQVNRPKQFGKTFPAKTSKLKKQAQFNFAKGQNNLAKHFRAKTSKLKKQAQHYFAIHILQKHPH